MLLEFFFWQWMVTIGCCLQEFLHLFSNLALAAYRKRWKNSKHVDKFKCELLNSEEGALLKQGKHYQLWNTGAKILVWSKVLNDLPFS